MKLSQCKQKGTFQIIKIGNHQQFNRLKSLGLKEGAVIEFTGIKTKTASLVFVHDHLLAIHHSLCDEVYI